MAKQAQEIDFLKFCSNVYTSMNNFANLLVRIVDYIQKMIFQIESFEKEVASLTCEVDSYKKQATEIVKAACLYINAYDDFLYYGKNTDFESIKDNIKQADFREFKEFFSRMNGWLQPVGEAQKIFFETCDKTIDLFIKCADKCCQLEVEAKANILTARVGSVASVALAGLGVFGSICAGAFTLGVAGAVAGTVGFLMAGAGGVAFTEDVASNFEKTEAKLNSMRSSVRDIVSQGTQLKSDIDELCIVVQRFENAFNSLEHTNTDHVNTLCSALDHLKWVLESEHSETSKAIATESVNTLKAKLAALNN